MPETHYTQNKTSVQIEVPEYQEFAIQEAVEKTGVSRDEIAREALKRLLNEIRVDKQRHYHAVI